MGAWGHQFDENDSAGDWLAAFADSPSWAAVTDALQSGLASAYEYLEVDEGSAVLAAAEIVAAAFGKASPRLEPQLATWAVSNSAGAFELKSIAGEAVLAVRDGGELHELWHEGDAGEWLATVDDLHSRLN
jgi:glycine/D-amino acid oxidase-like deaminating enzyme